MQVKGKIVGGASSRLYSTRPNVRIGNSNSLLKDWFVVRCVLISNTTGPGVNNNTTQNSSSLMKNGFINKFGKYQFIETESVKVIKFN